MTRRTFLRSTALATGAVAVGAVPYTACSRPASRSFKLALTPGSIGLQVDQREAIRQAAAYGFEAVEPYPSFLADASAAEVEEIRALLETNDLVWAAAGLPVDFRRDAATFREGLADLPRLAAGLERAGVTRVGTWLRPSHDELTYLANFTQHTERLREIAVILGDHGLRFGLEYVGPKTSWTAARHAFIHTMAETKELIAAIDRPTVGFVLDSWHWYTAGETAADLRSLTNADVVSCDLNDAPAGLAVDEQQDLKRELPGATGVIDLAAFLGALVAIGYDGPIRPEPFNAALNALPPDERLAMTTQAMQASAALVA